TGAPGQGPMRAGAAIADVAAGLYAALGVFAALVERETSGEGQWVQSSLLMAQIALMDFQAARYLIDGEVPEQVGNDHPTMMPTSTYRTSDGWVNIAAAGNVIWVRLANEVGVPCGPIYTMDQVFADPQVRHIGAAATVVHPRLGELSLVNQAARLSR